MKRFLSYVIFFIIIATGTTGLVVVTGPSKPMQNAGVSDEQIGGGAVETPPLTESEKAMQAVMNGVEGLMNGSIEAQAGLTVKLAGAVAFSADLNVRLALDMTDLASTKAAVSGSISRLGVSENVAFYYIDDTLYLAARGGKFKIAVGSVGQAIAAVTEYLGLDFGGIEVPGVDALSALVKDAALTEGEAGSRVDLTLNASALLPSFDQDIVVRLDLDENGAFAAASISDLAISGGLSLDVSVRFIQSDFTISVDAPDEYTDLSFAPALIEGVLHTAALRQFDLSGHVLMGGDTDLRLNVQRLLLDLTGGRAEAQLAVSGPVDFSGKLNYENDTLYLDTYGKRFRLPVSAAGELAGSLSGLLPSGASPLSALPDALSSFNIDTVMDVLAAFKTIRGVETPDGGTQIAVTVDTSVLPGMAGDVTLTLTVSPEKYITHLTVEGLRVAGVTLSAELALSAPGEAVEIAPVEAAGYTDLSFAPALVNGIVNTASLTQFDLAGSIALSGAVDLRADIASLLLDIETLRAEAALSLAGAVRLDAGIAYYQDTIYLEALGKKFGLPTSALKEILSSFTNGKALASPSLTAKTLDLSSLFSMLLSLSGETTAGGDTVLAVQADLSALVPELTGTIGLRLTVGADGYVSALSVTGLEWGELTVSLDLALRRPGEAVSFREIVPAEYTDLSFAPALVNGLRNSVLGRQQFLMGGTVKVVGGKNLTGEKNWLQADISDFRLDLSGGLQNLKVSGKLDLTGAFDVQGSLAYNDHKVYLDYLGLKVRMTDSVIAELVSAFGLDLSGAGFGGVHLDMEQIAGYLGYLKDIGYTETAAGTAIRIVVQGEGVNGGEAIFAELLVNPAGYLSRIELSGIVSALDGSRISVSLRLPESDPGAVDPVRPQDGDYVDFDALPALVEAFRHTAAMDSFALKSYFDIARGDGTRMTADPSLTIELDETRSLENMKVSGRATVDTLAMDVGFWYNARTIYANVNELKVKLSLDSAGGVLNAVMALLGMDGSVESTISGINDMIAQFRLNEIEKIVHSIATHTAEDGSVSVSVLLDSAYLYKDSSITDYVTITLTMCREQYFTRLDVANVHSGTDTFDFWIALDNVAGGVAQPVKADDVPAENFIDISGIAPIIDAFSVTQKHDYFHVTGTLASWAIPDRSVDFKALLDPVTRKPVLSFRVEYDYFFKHYTNTLYYNGDGYLYFEMLKGSSVTMRKRATFEEFMADPVTYVNYLLDISLLNNSSIKNAIANSSGGDPYKCLLGMEIAPEGAGQKVTTTISLNDLAGVSIFNDMPLVIHIDGDGEIAALTCTVKIVSIINLDVSLTNRLGETPADPLAGFNAASFG